MNGIDLDELERKAKTATPGSVAERVTGNGVSWDERGWHVRTRAHADDNYGLEAARRDEEFIAAASPDVVLALVARVRELESKAAVTADKVMALLETAEVALRRTSTSDEAIGRAIRETADSFRQFSRNGRWGACGACPRDRDRHAYPEFCAFTDRYDHQLNVAALAFNFIASTRTS